jgi:spore coat protein A
MLPAVHPTLGYEPWTSVHLHGSASLPQFDGYASDITRPGQFKDYHYPNFQTSRPLWYHDHGVGHTAENVYHGLVAQYHLIDALEESLPIPQGAYDIPLTITDAMFNNDGSLLFTLDDESGLWGDVILVNGRPWPVMKVERRKYRFRILGAAVSRSWKFSLDSGDPIAVVATDAGLMPSPQYVTSFRVASSERHEVIIDFSKYPIGRRVILQNSSPKNNRNFANTDKIMAFDVSSDPTSTENNSIPDVLNPNSRTMALRPEDSMRTRTFRLKRQHGQWTINGNTWDDVVKSNFQLLQANPEVNDLETWVFQNDSGGWFHPAHVHLVDVKILDRNGKPPFPHELGPKDVVYVGENETVRVLVKFDDGQGKYMMHCHNLVHEDHDMMGQFEVTPRIAGNDPLGTPALSLSEEAAHPL